MTTCVPRQADSPGFRKAVLKAEEAISRSEGCAVFVEVFNGGNRCVGSLVFIGVRASLADVFNRFRCYFVDNLNASLIIGIRRDDLKLENLEVKETALDDLDLPVKLKFGYLFSLVLKIYWKNLRNEPVIPIIDGLYRIVLPNEGVAYNEEKAKKNAAEVKRKTLARLEEARKNRRKPQIRTSTHLEKTVAQTITTG